MKKLGVRHWLGLLVLALPAVFFVPGIGFESSNPTALARPAGGPPTWFYRVQNGDSLTTISERELGTFRRFKEVLALNPGIKPRSLQAGDVLRMPAREAGATASPPAGETSGGRAPSSHRLLLSLAGLLTLVVLIVIVAGRMERTAYYEA